MQVRRTRGWIAVALGLCLAALGSGGAALADELSMEEVVSMLSARQLGEVYEVEREHDGYEVKILDPEGAWLVLYVDLTSGEILHEERLAPGSAEPDGPDENDDDTDDESDEPDDESDDESEQESAREGDA